MPHFLIVVKFTQKFTLIYHTIYDQIILLYVLSYFIYIKQILQTLHIAGLRDKAIVDTGVAPS